MDLSLGLRLKIVPWFCRVIRVVVHADGTVEVETLYEYQRVEAKEVHEVLDMVE